jgi:hypothetical protein
MVRLKNPSFYPDNKTIILSFGALCKERKWQAVVRPAIKQTAALYLLKESQLRIFTLEKTFGTRQNIALWAEQIAGHHDREALLTK